MLKERIDNEFKAALKDKNGPRVSCLRMLKSDMHNLSIEKRGELGDEDIMRVIQKQIKQHKDSIEQFKLGKRDDLVQKETKELAILESFLPKQLSKDELQALVANVIKDLGASTKKDMGKVMKEVIARAKGGASAAQLSQIASQLLS